MPSHPGLEIAMLQTHRQPRRNLEQLIQRAGAHLDRHDGYVAFSGGKDSTVALDIARRADPAVPVCFFDSGLEFPETLAYIDKLADRWNLNLRVVTAKPSALDYLQANGSWTHQPTNDEPVVDGTLHQTLITIPVAQAHQVHGAGEIWGIRAEESRGRRIMLLKAVRSEIATACNGCCPGPTGGQSHTAHQRRRHGGVVRRKDHTVAFSPVWDWNTGEIHQHLAREAIAVNPIYRKLQTLGAPAFLQRVSLIVDANSLGFGRMVWLRQGWPELYEQLREALPRIAEFT